MGAMAFQINGVTIASSTVYSGSDKRKEQGSASLAFVRVIHWSPVNSPQKGPVTQRMFLFDGVIIITVVCDWFVSTSSENFGRFPFYEMEVI